MSGSPLRSTTPSKSELSPACDDNDPSPIDSEHRGASPEAFEEQESDDKSPSPQFLLDPLELFEVKPMQNDFAHECVHIRSWNIDSDDDDDGDVSPWFYAICGSELKDDLNNHMIMALQCQDADLADRITGMYQPSAIILSFNLEAPSNADSDSRTRHSDAPELREHLLACATSPSPIVAYIYYLGFLEHVFRKVLKLAEWSKETSDAECDLQDVSCAETEGREPEHELDGAIIEAHSSAIFEDRREFPELSASYGDVEVAENLAYQAYRRLGPVLPLYLRHARRGNVPMLVLVFRGADALTETSVRDNSEDALSKSDNPSDDSHPSYTLFDLLCSSLRALTEDGLRAVFTFTKIDSLRMQPEDAMATRRSGEGLAGRYAKRRSRFGTGICSEDMVAIRSQAQLEAATGTNTLPDTHRDIFGAVLHPDVCLPSRPTTPPSSQTPTESSAESSASKGVLTPRSIIKLSVQANEKAASIRRALGDDGVLRAIKRAKVDVIPTTVPRLRRRMKGQGCDRTPSSRAHLRKTCSTGGSKLRSSRSAVRHSAKTPCSP